MPRIDDPPEIEGFEYWYRPTAICFVAAPQVLAHYITPTNPTGRHKLFRGGYRCTRSTYCYKTYCYKCVTEYFGKDGMDTLATHHYRFCDGRLPQYPVQHRAAPVREQPPDNEPSSSSTSREGESREISPDKPRPLVTTGHPHNTGLASETTGAKDGMRNQLGSTLRQPQSGEVDPDDEEGFTDSHSNRKKTKV